LRPLAIVSSAEAWQLSSMAEPDARTIFVCKWCRSKLVTGDAWAEWSESTQAWVLGAIYDYTFCHACESATQPDQITLGGTP
jgi:hypothetical protein